jgi:hypothetical protein
MNWKEYKIVMKHSGLSWLGHILPFGVVVAFKMVYTRHFCDFNKEKCTCIRFGNSGLFLVFSKRINEVLEQSREKTAQWEKEAEQEQKRKQYEKLREEFEGV